MLQHICKVTPCWFRASAVAMFWDRKLFKSPCNKIKESSFIVSNYIQVWRLLPSRTWPCVAWGTAANASQLTCSIHPLSHFIQFILPPLLLHPPSPTPSELVAITTSFLPPYILLLKMALNGPTISPRVINWHPLGPLFEGHPWILINEICGKAFKCYGYQHIN